MTLTKPFADYPHTKRVGPIVFIAGQGCRDPESDRYPGTTFDASGQLLTYDIGEQTRGVIANVERALASAGLTRKHIADVTVFLTNMQDFEAMNGAWNEWFQGESPPTRTTVAVRQLPGHNQIEMKAIAMSQTDSEQEGDS